MKDAPAKITCLVFYSATLLSLLFDWPPVLEAILQYGSAFLLIAHAIEVVVAWRWIRLYEGPLVLSVLFTLLFGFVHWMPYKRRALAEGAR